jgi:hypothetical protein
MNRTMRCAALFMLPMAAMPIPTFADAAAMTGERIGDAAMSCEAIATEHLAISNANARRAGGQKSRKRLFGFAKSLASMAVPGAALLAGGSAPLQSLVAREAGRTLLDAASANPVSADPLVATPDAEQQARLVQLATLAQEQHCAG